MVSRSEWPVVGRRRWIQAARLAGVVGLVSVAGVDGYLAGRYTRGATGWAAVWPVLLAGLAVVTVVALAMPLATAWLRERGW